MALDHLLGKEREANSANNHMASKGILSKWA